MTDISDPKGGRRPRTKPRLSPTSVDHITHGIAGRKLPRWTIWAVLAVAVLVTAGVVVATRSQDDTPTVQVAEDSAARSLLMDLADRSDSQPAVTTDALPVLHATSEGPESVTNGVSDATGHEQTSTFLITSRTEEWWLSSDRVRRIRRQIGDREPLNATAVQTIATDPPMPEVAFRGVLVEQSDMMPATNQSFPDARAEDELFTSLVENLERAHADNHLRAGWLRTLASVHAMRVVPDQTDRLGRPGIGVAFTTRNQGVIDHVVILDPTTGALLGLRDTLIEPSGDEFPSPIVRKDVAFTVDAVPAAPQPEIVN